MQPTTLPPVEVDPAACERLAATLRGMAIPDDREDVAPAGPAAAELGNAYLALVAVCHQTQSLRGTVGGRPCRGWDYLQARWLDAVARDPGWLTPARWAATAEPDLRRLFADPAAGPTLSDPAGRAALLRDLGRAMRADGFASSDDLLRAADRRVAVGSPNLLGLLARFRAYDDPVQKKSALLLGLWRSGAGVRYRDEENLPPPVDYHEVRGHLRIGTVRVHDPALLRKLRDRRAVTRGEDVAIRSAVRAAIESIARRAGPCAPPRLHYLFWHLFRSVCLRDAPRCHAAADPGALPDRYAALAVGADGAPGCPFAVACLSVDAERPLWEHLYSTDWY